MKNNRTRLAAAAPVLLSEGNAPPSEFLIWPLGTVETTHGKFLFDETAAKNVMAAAADWGNRYTFDYDHAEFAPGDRSAAPALAAGSFLLELREDGLWATDIRWTERAAAYLTAGEILYFSPAFNVDEDGRIALLWNIALTNLPATKGLTPLVAARALDLRSPDVRASVLLADLYDLLEDVIEAAFGPMWIVEIANDWAVFHLDGRGGDTLLQVPYTLVNDAVKLGPTAVEVRREYAPVPEGKTMKTVLNKLGLSDTATEAQALERVTELDTLRGEILTLSGRATPAEALGALRAAVDASKQVEALNAELAGLKAEKRSTELAGLIDQGVADGKITPATRAFWEAKDPAELRAYLSVAPKLPILEDPTRAPSEAAGAGQSYEKLTNEQRHDLAVGDPATFQALRADAVRRGVLKG